MIGGLTSVNLVEMSYSLSDVILLLIQQKKKLLLFR